MEGLRLAGITHVRVPFGYWITGDIAEDEPYVSGQWKYFARMVKWARARGISVWIDLHAAPGSQNGFDNSGRIGNATWDKSMENVNRTLSAIEWISKRIKEEGLLNDITGFGLLNEPDQHINYWRMLSFYNHAYELIRKELYNGVSVYIGDMFNPQSFNWFWHNGNPIQATNVFLDSHIYACFVDDLKAMTPKQHITQVCRFERAHINQCCWDGWPPAPTELGRFVGEWTAAFDRTPSPELEKAYENDQLKYVSPELTPERKKFLRQYVMAQIATYEATPDDSIPYQHGAEEFLDFHGWFFWNFKMEADVYREWDYLRGVREGWIPILEHGLSIFDQFGFTCQDLEHDAIDCTDNVVDPFPVLKDWKGVSCKNYQKSISEPKRAKGENVVIILAIFSAFALVAALFIAYRTVKLSDNGISSLSDLIFGWKCGRCCSKSKPLAYQRINEVQLQPQQHPVSAVA
mmetsp:Transcript_6158/g.7880  ORF Transcript_6158/g.7880 Transcript_6158/m.7880 type:complete len:462 (+) Transcript_6158:387-1772(+)